MTLLVFAADVLVSCTRSGLVLVFEAVVENLEERAAAGDCIYKKGIDARFHGKTCPGCRTLPTGGAMSPSCEYRPLRGPLFVPRPARLGVPTSLSP